MKSGTRDLTSDPGLFKTQSNGLFYLIEDLANGL